MPRLPQSRLRYSVIAERLVLLVLRVHLCREQALPLRVYLSTGQTSAINDLICHLRARSPGPECSPTDYSDEDDPFEDDEKMANYSPEDEDDDGTGSGDSNSDSEADDDSNAGSNANIASAADADTNGNIKNERDHEGINLLHSMLDLLLFSVHPSDISSDEELINVFLCTISLLPDGNWRNAGSVATFCSALFYIMRMVAIHRLSGIETHDIIE